MQSVPITTEALSWYPAHCEVYSINHYAIRFVSDLGLIVFFLSLLFHPPVKLTATI